MGFVEKCCGRCRYWGGDVHDYDGTHPCEYPLPEWLVRHLAEERQTAYYDGQDCVLQDGQGSRR